MRGYAWLERAACRGLDPELFFPTRGQRLDPAKAVCRRCPVAAQCSEWAAESGSSGVWAGRARRGRSARLGRTGEAAQAAG